MSWSFSSETETSETMNVYNLNVVWTNEIRNYMVPTNMTYFLFNFNMLFSLIFFFIMLMLAYLQKLPHCLIIYSYMYKTNPSVLPCPWNLRSIGPSNFKLLKFYWMWLVFVPFKGISLLILETCVCYSLVWNTLNM